MAVKVIMMRSQMEIKYVTGEWRKGDPCHKMAELGLIAF